MDGSGFSCPECGHVFRVQHAYRARLSRRETQVLNFIIGRAANGLPAPTYQEISHALGRKSRGNVACFITGLVERGMLTRMSRRRRSLRITPEALELLKESPHVA